MKNIKILIVTFITMSTTVIAQNTKKKKLIFNNELVEEFFSEYIAEAEIRGLFINDLLDVKIDFILVENDTNERDERLIGKKLSLLDADKKLILLSEVCLVDFTLLKSELFKQLSFLLGVKPYGKNTIISNEFTPKYTNAYLTNPELAKEEYDFMFSELRKII